MLRRKGRAAERECAGCASGGQRRARDAAVVLVWLVDYWGPHRLRSERIAAAWPWYIHDNEDRQFGV